MIYLVAVYTEKVLNPKMGFDSFFIKKHYNKRVVEFKTMPSNDELKIIIQKHYLKNRFLEYFSKRVEVKYYLLSDSPYAPIVNGRIYSKFNTHGKLIKEGN